jgi:hypothetical protein
MLLLLTGVTFVIACIPIGRAFRALVRGERLDGDRVFWSWMAAMFVSSLLLAAVLVI